MTRLLFGRIQDLGGPTLWVGLSALCSPKNIASPLVNMRTEPPVLLFCAPVPLIFDDSPRHVECSFWAPHFLSRHCGHCVRNDLRKLEAYEKSSSAIFGGVSKKCSAPCQCTTNPKFAVSGPSSLVGFAVFAPSPLPSSSLLLSAPAMSIWKG